MFLAYGHFFVFLAQFQYLKQLNKRAVTGELQNKVVS